MTMRKTAKIAIPLSALVLGAAAGTAHYLTNGTDTAAEADANTAATAAPAGVAQASMGDPDDPATWRLPIQAYMPTQSQAKLVTSTRDDLIDQCMDKAGYPAWKPAPDLPQVGGKTLTDWRYGIHDASLSAKRGYHPAAGEQQAYDAAMEEGAVDESGAPDGAVRGCVTEVDGHVPAVQTEGIVQQISGESFAESHKDPVVVAAFAKWSACMKGKGYSYKAPMDANDDIRFADPHKVSQLEIETAEADIACRNEADVTRTWFEAESAIQRSKIAANLKEINAAAEATKQAVAKAKAA
ncbi:hypothetical protein ACGFZU_42295 [Streptomyces tendae]|uniref:hypothetical protein n=1 Tax=Streptomyces tendae TaxID=1932 RepID=UPI0037101DAE